jgi:hypothetical protein
MSEIMLTLNIEYEVLPDRLVTIKLPETVHLGRHEMVIVLEEQPSQKVPVTEDKVAKLSDFIKKRYELSLSEPVLKAEEVFTLMASRHGE